jgi:hypothetical protein
MSNKVSSLESNWEVNHLTMLQSKTVVSARFTDEQTQEVCATLVSDKACIDIVISDLSYEDNTFLEARIPVSVLERIIKIFKDNKDAVKPKRKDIPSTVSIDPRQLHLRFY